MRVWLGRVSACGLLLIVPLLHPAPAVIRVRLTHLLGAPDTGRVAFSLINDTVWQKQTHAVPMNAQTYMQHNGRRPTQGP